MIDRPRIRIAIDAHRLISESPYTSGAVYLGSMLGHWVQRAPEVGFELLVPSLPRPDSPWHDSLHFPNVTLHVPRRPSFPVASYRAQLFWQQIEIPRMARRVRPDLYFSPFHLTPLMPAPWPVVSTIHDVCFLNEPFFSVGHLVHRWQVNTACWRAKSLICVSQFTRDALSKWSPRAGRKAVVVPNGLTRPMLSRARALECFHELNPPVRPGGYFIWVGNPCQERKNIPLLIESFKMHLQNHPSDKLLMLIPPHARPAMEGLVAAAGVRTAVALLSGVKDEVRDALYRLAIALVFPSTCEGFGYPVLEAILQGCPPVAARTGPAMEIACRACPLTADFLVESFVGGMKRYAGMLERDRSVLERDLRRQAETYSLGRMAEGTLDVLAAAAKHCP